MPRSGTAPNRRPRPVCLAQGNRANFNRIGTGRVQFKGPKAPILNDITVNVPRSGTDPKSRPRQTPNGSERRGDQSRGKRALIVNAITAKCRDSGTDTKYRPRPTSDGPGGEKGLGGENRGPV